MNWKRRLAPVVVVVTSLLMVLFAGAQTPVTTNANGTYSPSWHINGPAGPQIAVDGGVFEARNPDGGSFVPFRAADPSTPDDLATKRYADTLGGARLSSTAVTGSGFWHSTGGTLDGAANKGTAGQLACTQPGATDVAWCTLAGDLSCSTLTPGQCTAVGLQGHGVASTAPTQGQFLVQGASTWGPVSPSGDFTCSAVTPGLCTVSGVRGTSIPSPAAGYLYDNGSTLSWDKSGITQLVFQPGGTAGGQIFTSWSSLVSAASTIPGRISIFVDATHNGGTATVPAGSWAFTNTGVELDGDMELEPTLKFANGATMSGVTVYGFGVDMENDSSSPVVTYSSGTHFVFVRSNIVSTTSAPFFSVTGTGTSFQASLYSGAIGDNTHPVISTGTGASTVVIAEDAASVNPNALTGAGTNHVEIFDESSFVDPGYAAITTLDGVASLLFYNDNAVAPTIGKSNVQGAIDFLKTSSGGAQQLVFQPSGTAAGQIFTSWSALVAAAAALPAVNGGPTVFFDCSHVSGNCTIPTGASSFPNGATFIAATTTSAANATSLTFANGATLSGVRSMRGFLSVISQSVTPVITASSGTTSIWLTDTVIAGSTSPFFAVTGTAIYTINLDRAALGDGTHAEVNAATGTSVFVNVIKGNPLLSGSPPNVAANAFTGSGATTVKMFDATGINSSSTATTLRTRALNIGYDDTLASPTTGQTTSQGAIDYLKAKTTTPFELVYQPGGTATGNVFTSWSSLMTAAATIQGPLVIYFDGRFSSWHTTLPAGAFNFTQPDVTFASSWDPQNAPIYFFELDIATGTTISGLDRVKDMEIVSNSTAPVMTFSTNDNRFFRMDDAGIWSNTAAPFFNVTGTSTGLAIWEFTDSFLGDGIHAAVSAASGNFAEVDLFSNSTATAASMGGAGSNACIEVDPAALCDPAIGGGVTLESRANAVKYDDTLATPHISTTDVQASIDYLKARAIQPGTALVFQPGGTAAGNVFTSWSALMTAAATVQGPITVFFDGRHNANVCTVPAGAWAFATNDVTFEGSWLTPQTVVKFATGATLSGVARIGNVALENDSTAAVMTYADGLTHNVRIDGSVYSTTTAPFFSVSAASSLNLYLFEGSLGDGTHPAASTASVGSGVTVVEVFDADVEAGSVTGTGSNAVTISDVTSFNGTTIPPTLSSHAALLGYDDTLVPPTTAATTAQAAIDWLKGHAATTTYVTGSGVWHSSSGTLSTSAYKGTAGQALFTGAGATDTSWASFSGDFTCSATTPGACTLANSGVTAGSCGSASSVCVETLDAKGRATAATSTAISLTNSNLQAGAYPNITGTGTLTSGATGAGFTLGFGSSTISGVCTVPNGCSGAATEAAHGVLVGEGTSPFVAVGPGAANLPLLGGGASADPSFGQLPLGAGVVSGLLPAANQAAQTLGGDLAGTTASAQVVSISGASPINVTPNVIRWLSTSSTPTLTIAAPTSDVTTHDLLLAGEDAFGTAITFKAGGNATLQSGAGATGGTQGTARIRTANGNAQVLAQDNEVQLFCPSGPVAITASSVTVQSPTVNFEHTVSTPTISQDAPTTDVAPQPMGITPQPAYSGATGANKNGSYLLVKGGQQASGGTAGPVLIESGDGTTAIAVSPGGIIEAAFPNGSEEYLAHNMTGTINTQVARTFRFGIHGRLSPNGTLEADVDELGAHVALGNDHQATVYCHVSMRVLSTSGGVAKGDYYTETMHYVRKNVGGVVTTTANGSPTIDADPDNHMALTNGVAANGNGTTVGCFALYTGSGNLADGQADVTIWGEADYN